MPKANEFTVSGLDILNLVAGIDNRLNEVKQVSDKYKEEHPDEPKPDYKNMSIGLINRVVRNVLNGWKDDLPYILAQKLKADIIEDISENKTSMNMVDGFACDKKGVDLMRKQVIGSVNDLVNNVVKGLI